jgi:hypothetical protein
MSNANTDILLDAVAQGRVNTGTIAGILSEYFTAHREALWSDALSEHRLVTEN